MAEMIGNGLCHSFSGDGTLDILARGESTGALYLVPHSGRFRGTGTHGEPVKIAENFHHLLTLTEDGTLLAHVHSGKFDPDNPEATYAAGPEVVATGWQDFNSIS